MNTHFLPSFLREGKSEECVYTVRQCSIKSMPHGTWHGNLCTHTLHTNSLKTFDALQQQRVSPHTHLALPRDSLEPATGSTSISATIERRRGLGLGTIHCTVGRCMCTYLSMQESELIEFRLPSKKSPVKAWRGKGALATITKIIFLPLHICTS